MQHLPATSIAVVHLLLIGVGGFLGAIARYTIDGWVTDATRSSFPWGTLVVNMSGSFALGLLFALTVERAALPADLRAPVGIGFIGAYTTFSTFTLESLRLMQDGSWALAAANLVGSVLLGMAAVFAGVALGRAI